MYFKHSRALWLAPALASLVACGGGGGDDEPPVDPLEILDVRVEEITETSAVVRFRTTVGATAEVSYGVDALQLNIQAFTETATQDHALLLQPLTPQRRYFFRVAATSPGDSAQTDLFEFTTLAIGQAPTPTPEASPQVEPTPEADASAEPTAVPSATATPVEFLNLRVEELTARSAWVRFETSVETTCEIEYGIYDFAMDLRASDPDMEEGELSITHQVPLEDLSPDTEYFWRARAVDAQGEIWFSGVQSFRTAQEAPPEVELVNHALLSTGAAVSGVSSNWGGGDNDSGFGANKALDAQMSTEWSSDGDGDDAWIEITLPAPTTISHFGFRSRMMTNGTAIITAVQVIFDDGAASSGVLATPDHQQRYLFELDAPVTVSKARIEAVTTTGGNTGAKEIQLLAAP